MQHNENDFIIPALLVIAECPDGCSTDFIKRKIEKHIDLFDKDLLPYPSRNPNEPRYYQIVGNLISHKNPDLFQYIDVVFPEINVDKKSSKVIFKINSKGLDFIKSTTIETAQQHDDSKITDSIAEDEIIVDVSTTDTEDLEPKDDFTITDQFDQRIMNYALTNGLGTRPPTDSKISKTVIELNGYRCEYAMSVGKKHNLFNGKDKHPFMEGHHLIPMKATKDFFPLNLDRPSNIVSLCPGCHTLLHHATKDEKLKILKVLYENHIEQLNNDGIYISLEVLLEKYY